MFQYIIHVEDEGIRDWTYSTVDGRGRTLYTPYEIKINVNLDNDDITKFNTWYASDEPNAKQIAKRMAIAWPGRNVNIYKLDKVVQSMASPPVVAVWNEKGLMPE